MGLLQDIVHAITGGHPAAPQQGQASAMVAQKIAPSNFQPIQHAQMLPPPGQQHGYTPAQMNQMTPVGQPIPKAMMNSFSPQTRALAQIYQNNPQDPRVMHIDPAMFGYRPDNTTSQIHGPLLQQHGMASNYSTPIQGHQNPGLIPMQGSAFSHTGVGMTRGVQGASYAPIQAGNYNPQQNINF